jgi:DNA uptake protein ComE-like DNA-binding protein
VPPTPARRSRWPWLSLLPLGIGAWAPILAGVRARRLVWILLGVLWSAAVAVGWVLADGSDGESGGAGALIVVGWVGAIATSFAIRPAYERQAGSAFERAVGSAQDRLEERRRAERLAREQPELARELGVGRPDVPGASHAGLVDVNGAPVAVLARLPGIDDALAAEIDRVRIAVDGFSSLEDLGMTLGLDGGLVEDLRGRVVFLPR